MLFLEFPFALSGIHSDGYARGSWIKIVPTTSATDTNM